MPTQDTDVTREVERQLAILTRGADEILPLDDFRRKLERSVREGRPLRVKQGFDPTAPDIHLGHTVGLRKLRQFQELGHQVIVIVGDYTSMVGDPSGRSKTRPQLSAETIEAFARTYLDQFFSVVDASKTEIHRNGEWFAQMTFADILRLLSQYTVARLLERDDFAKRWQANQPISLHELMYPVMQGHDSVAIKADVELGGTEQKFNLLVGRTLQELAGQEPQVILTLPILVGLDGEQRMSKSLGNYVGIAEPAAEQFGKLMSIPDAQIVPYLTLVTDVSSEEIAGIERELAQGANPMTFKKLLAGKVAAMYHGAEAAARARESFESQFVKRGRPLEAILWTLPALEAWPIRRLLVDTGLAKSSGDAKRKIEEGAVEFGGAPVKDPQAEIALVPGRPVPVRLGRRWIQVTTDPGATGPSASPSPVPLPPE